MVIYKLLNSFEQEIVRFVSYYVRYVWTNFVMKDSVMKFVKYKADKKICGLTLGPIFGLGSCFFLVCVWFFWSAFKL